MTAFNHSMPSASATVPALARVLAVLFTVLGALMTIGPRASPIALAVLTLAFVAVLIYRGQSWRDLVTPSAAALAFLALAILGMLSASWAMAPVAAAQQAAFMFGVVVSTHLIIRVIANEQPSSVVLISGWYLIGFVLGAIFLLHEVATDQSFLLWLLNTFEALRLKPNKMQRFVDGHLAEIVPASLKWSIAGLNLFLWPALLITIALWRNAARVVLAGVVFVLASGLTLAATHTTSKLAIILASVAFLFSLRWPKFTHRALVATWTVLVLGVVPLALMASKAKLYEANWVPHTGQVRVANWGYVAAKVFDAPFLGTGVRTSYAEDEARSKGHIEPGLAETKVLSSPLRHPHNVYLQIWYELGAAGAILFLASGLLLLRAIAGLPAPAQAIAHAAWITVMIEVGSTWDIWQSWFISALGLSAIAIALAVRAAQTEPSLSSSGMTFSTIWLPRRAQRYLLGVFGAAILGLGSAVIANVNNRLEIDRLIRELALCQTAASTMCSQDVERLSRVLSSAPTSFSTNKWWPTRFRIFVENDTIVYFRPNCAPEDTAVDLFVLHVWPRDASNLPEDRKQFGFYNHSFYFSGKPYAGKSTGRGYRSGTNCLALSVLPTPNVKKILVGQYISESKKFMWAKAFKIN